MTDATGDAPQPARLGYAICSIGRSGSSWFSELLGGTGVLGRPRDYFNTSFQRSLFGDDYPAARASQIDRVLSEGVTPNGVYALKVFPIHLHAATRQVRWTARLPNLRFVHWKRRDLLGQALSRHRALQTMQWRSNQESRLRPTYDGLAILEAMRWLLAQDARWELFFARNAIAPLRLIYEEALQAPQDAVDAVARLLDLDGPRPRIGPASVAFDVQRDETTERWRTRFLDTFGDLDTIDIF